MLESIRAQGHLVKIGLVFIGVALALFIASKVIGDFKGILGLG